MADSAPHSVALHHSTPRRSAAIPPGSRAPVGQPEAVFERVSHGGFPPIVLTARGLITARPDVVDALRVACYAIRMVAGWQRLLDALDEHPIDAVLVDLDAADQTTHRHLLEMSRHRLVALLARRRVARGFALVVHTSLDFAEIESLVRQGVDALVSPEHSAEQVIVHIEAARRCAAMRRRPDRVRWSVQTLPIPPEDAYWQVETHGLDVSPTLGSGSPG
jgi:hypothetical protein